MRYFVYVTLIIGHFFSTAQVATSDLELLNTALDEKHYEQVGMSITDANFFELDDSYHHFTDYPLLIIHGDGTREAIHFQYEGFPKLIDKKDPILNSEFQSIEKADIAYVLFDKVLFKNMDVGNMVSVDFAIVCIEGPISVYREYYTAPITKENIASGFRIFKDGKEAANFYLGKFENKVAKLVKDFPELSDKVDSKQEGYTESDETLFKVVLEYNNWVKQNDPNKYPMHSSIKLEN